MVPMGELFTVGAAVVEFLLTDELLTDHTTLLLRLTLGADRLAPCDVLSALEAPEPAWSRLSFGGTPLVPLFFYSRI